MKGILPDEFPFSRRRKPTTRRKKTAAVEAAPVAAPVAPAPVASAPVASAPVASAQIATAPAETAAVAKPVETAETHVIPVNRHATSRASVTPLASGASVPAASVIAAPPRPAAPAPEPIPAYKGPERRRSPRQSLRAKATYRNDLNPAAAGPVQILNFSMCGLRFWSTKAMKVGERGMVKMEIGPVKWTGRVKVVTCNPQDDEGYALGCEFAANEVGRRAVA
jgi:hypothetical protein